MKKNLIITLLLLVTLSLCSFTTPKNVVNILERTNRMVVRNVNNLSINDRNIDDVMLSIGLTQDMIKNLPQKSKDDYKIAKQIYSVEINYDNCYVGFTDITEVAIDGSAPTPDKIEHEANPLENDSYMKMVYVFTELPNRELKFSVDAEWIRMPFFRYTDSLGCTCMDSTVIPISRMGYYTCDYEMEYNGYKNFMKIRNDFTNVDFQEASNGDFYGSACVFKLPIDMDVSSSTNGRVYHRYKNLKVHYEYKGHYKGSNDNPFINTSATYCHQRLGVDFTPSIEVSFSGYPQIGFGFGVGTNYEYRTVGFDSDIKLKLI